MRVLLVALLAAISYAQTVTITSFHAYPGTASDSSYGGIAILTWSGQTLVIEYHFQTYDQTCEDGPLDGVANSCGIHIHSGTSCESAADVGGHYWEMSEFSQDPWSDIVYGQEVGSSELNYGFTYDSSVGRAFVIHNSNGTRITCDLIPEGTSVVENENDDSNTELSRGLIIVIAAVALIVVCCFFGCYKLLNVLDGEERDMIVKDLTTRSNEPDDDEQDVPPKFFRSPATVEVEENQHRVNYV